MLELKKEGLRSFGVFALVLFLCANLTHDLILSLAVSLLTSFSYILIVVLWIKIRKTKKTV